MENIMSSVNRRKKDSTSMGMKMGEIVSQKSGVEMALATPNGRNLKNGNRDSRCLTQSGFAINKNQKNILKDNDIQ